MFKATTRPACAIAFGVSIRGDTFRCGLLFVKGAKKRLIGMRKGKTTYYVRLPKEAVTGAAMRFSMEELEIVSVKTQQRGKRGN